MIEIEKYNRLIPFIVQIGTGGTGGYVVQHVSQMLSTLNREHVYILADPDVIESKNLGNQLFLEEEVGLNKADVLAERYSHSFGLNLWSNSEKYIETIDDLKNLFQIDYAPALDTSNRYLPILIGCVDNNYSRKIMNDFFQCVPTLIYIDAGNESVEVPVGWQTTPQYQWTNEEKEQYANSGYSGQVVVGVKKDGKVLQNPVAGVYPDILEDNDSIAPSELSCAELSSSEPQRIITNKFASLAVVNALQEIISEQCVTYHITLFHAKKGYMRSIERIEDEEII